MRYTVTLQRIQVLGTMWMPNATAATEKDLSAYDMENIGDPHNRDDVEHWLLLHTGDFSNVLDFRADFHIGDEHIVHEWKSEESEWTFNECMYPSDDE